MSGGSDTFRAQNGEDRWLHAHFEGKRSGFYIEVGAYDGVHLSNSYHFEQLGWSGVLVEPDPVKAELCRRNRPRATTYACAVVAPGEGDEVGFLQVAGGEVYSSTSPSAAHRERLRHLGLQGLEFRVAARTLDSILEQTSPSAIDFVSIDVEGGELAVLKGFDIGRWRPAVVMVETNARLRDPAVRAYFVAAGYAYLHSIDVNDFYAPAAGGGVAARALDALRYLGYRVRRRIRRLGELLRRAWRKHLRDKFRA